MGASEDDAASEGADSCGPSTDSIPVVRIWGPVPKAQAVGAGALAAASSVVLAPQQAPVWLFNWRLAHGGKNPIRTFPSPHKPFDRA